MAKTRPASTPSQLTFPIVGVGASAGGIEALRTFFEALPARSGAAYVIVLHLAPDHASVLPDVLRAVTAMPVVQVIDATPIEVNHVYVIAPSMVLTMVDSFLRVKKARSNDDRRAAIDLFLRSLADSHRERAVGMIFSGAGSDGSVGITRVKELGGITIAQHPDEAAFASMPRAAIVTDMIDFVLPVAEIPQRLMDLWITARRIQLPEHVEPDQAQAEAAESTEERVLREIMVILRTRTSHDFRHYKRATILRRIERRLQVNGLTELQEYRDYLHEHPEETPLLLQDMLISVTNFFATAKRSRRYAPKSFPIWCRTAPPTSRSAYGRPAAPPARKPTPSRCCCRKLPSAAMRRCLTRCLPPISTSARSRWRASGCIPNRSWLMWMRGACGSSSPRMHRTTVSRRSYASTSCSRCTTCSATRRSRGSTWCAAATC